MINFYKAPEMIFRKFVKGTFLLLSKSWGASKAIYITRFQIGVFFFAMFLPINLFICLEFFGDINMLPWISLVVFGGASLAVRRMVEQETKIEENETEFDSEYVKRKILVSNIIYYALGLFFILISMEIFDLYR